MKSNRARSTSVALGLATVLSLLVLASPAFAQDARPPAAKAGDILAQFPAGSVAERDALAGAMLASGEPGLASLTRQLVPAGSGNDTAVRFALNAMAIYASQFGAEPRRALAERALVKALAAASDPEVRTFLLSQLRLVGRDAAAKAAAPYLFDTALVEPATQLMLSVRTPSAQKALLAALTKTTGESQITIVKALGELKVAQANGRLLKFAKDPNPAMRRPALAALASIASPKSYTTLVDAATAANFRHEPANAVGALLEYARQLSKGGGLATAEKICRLVMKNADGEGRLPTKAAALAILADARGVAALPDLLTAVDHADRGYRNAALMWAERIGGAAPVREWIAKAQKVDPERRAEIIGMLGRQADARALPFIRASLAASEPEVVIAAANALAHMERAEAVPDLLALLKTASGDTAGRVAAILLWTIDERHLDPLATMLDSLEPKAKAAAIGVIGARGGRRFAGRILPLTLDGNAEIRTAAFGALSGVVTAGDLPTLFGMLDGAETETIAPLQRAVVAAAIQITPETGRALPLVQAIKTSGHPERIVELLPQIGGPQALAAAIEQFESSSANVKAAAFRALVRWPGPEAGDRLLAIVASGNETYRNQALPGFIRQLSASSLPDDQKLLRLRKALAQTSTLGDRRILIRALERVKTYQSFLVAASFLDDTEIASDAAGAVMRIVLPTPARRDGLSGTLVRNALNQALQALKGPQSADDRESIRAYLTAMPQDEGFVPMFNGKDLTGWKGLVENPIRRAKMSPEELAAKQIAADEKMRTNWSVGDGTIVFNGSGDNMCSVRDYGDFEMLADWRITKDGDSGIYLRGSPQVQIWDPARVDVGAEVGSGGLYNNQKNPSKPLVFADNPVGEWNTFRITMIGDKVTVFLNGIKVVDNVTMENYWDRKQPIFARGAIELQAHGTDLAFRDVYVREIASGDVAPKK